MTGTQSKKAEDYFEKHAEKYFREGYLEASTERFYFETRRRIVRRMIGDPGKSVLDMGAGPGIMSLPLLDSPGTRLTVVDISREMLLLVEKQLSGFPGDVRKRVSLVHGDVFEQEFPTGSFDVIICAGLLAHVPRVGDLLDRIAGWLKPGGRCIIQITNASHPAGFLQVFLANLRNIYDYRLNHTRAGKIRRSIRKSGLEIREEARYHLRLPGMRKLGRAFLARFEQGVFTLCGKPGLAFLGQDVIFMAEKKAEGAGE
jgi:ubiquinone/menaquinone biosynthesis C-methylase UbiE